MRENYDSKVTYVPNQTTSFFGHYSASPSNITDPQIFGENPGGGTFNGGQPGNATGLIQNVGLGFTHAFTAHPSTDWNAGYARQRLGAQAPDISLGDYGVDTLGDTGHQQQWHAPLRRHPGLLLSSAYASVGNANTGSPFHFRDNQYTGKPIPLGCMGCTPSASVASTSMRPSTTFSRAPAAMPPHAISLCSRAPPPSTTPRPTRPTTLPSFLLGQAENYQKSVQSFNPEPLRYSTFAFYAQDTFQISPKLTLNHGVRYVYYPLPVGDHFGTVRYDPSVRSTVTDVNGTHSVGTVLVGGENAIPNHANTDNGWGMIVPRLGVSYSPDTRAVVRFGYGLTTDPDTLRNLLQAYPAGIATNINGANGYLPATSLNPGLLSPVTQVGVPNIVLPDIAQGYLPLPSNLSTHTILQQFRRGYIERIVLDLSAESFDVINTPQFANPGTVGINSVSNQTNPTAAQLGGFGIITSSNVNRTLRLSGCISL